MIDENICDIDNLEFDIFFNMKVFDSFIFFNELELLEMRLNILGDVVDKFVLTESPYTVSGNE